MPGTPLSRGRHRSTVAVVLLYGLVVFGASFLHHDFACHQNSRTHCTACSVSQYAQKSESHGVPLDAMQHVSGRVELRAPVTVATPVLVFISDRAPPV
jgi:hypothetical protein